MHGARNGAAGSTKRGETKDRSDARRGRRQHRPSSVRLELVMVRTKTQMQSTRDTSAREPPGESRPLGIRRSSRSPIELQSGDPRSAGDERSNEVTTTLLRPPSLSAREETIAYIGGSPLKRSPRRDAEQVGERMSGLTKVQRRLRQTGAQGDGAERSRRGQPSRRARHAQGAAARQGPEARPLQRPRPHREPTAADARARSSDRRAGRAVRDRAVARALRPRLLRLGLGRSGGLVLEESDDDVRDEDDIDHDGRRDGCWRRVLGCASVSVGAQERRNGRPQ